uniref:OTU domain-containing protein n=1 Tax=Ditylenchus dipsaci TaxID=166011 RepID=A0A915CNY0_9BILA
MAASHPTVWKLLTAVMDGLILADQRVSSYWSGGNTPRRNNAYLQLSERLRKTVERYAAQPKLEYLKSIAHNLGGFFVEKNSQKAKKSQSSKVKSAKWLVKLGQAECCFFEHLDKDIQDELCLSFDLQIGEIRPGNKLQQILFNSETSKPKNFKQIQGDGNCLFRSIIYCISSTEENHERVRYLIVEFMKKYPNKEWRQFWQRKESCTDMEIAAKNSSDVARYGSTVHIIAAAKLLDVNILTYNKDIGWTLYTPDIETGPSPELLQDAEKPTFALYYNGSHFDVIIEI